MNYELKAPQPPKGGVVNCQLSIVNYELKLHRCRDVEVASRHGVVLNDLILFVCQVLDSA